MRLESRNRGENAQDGYGAETESWGQEGTARAGVRPLGVVERAEAARKTGECTHMVTIRGRHLQPTSAKRFVWYDHRVARDRILEIVGVMDYDERGQEMRVLCKEAQ